MSYVINDLKARDTLRRTSGMAAMVDKETGKPFRFPTIEAVILHYGRHYDPAPRPKGLRRGKKQECFRNALRAATNMPDFVYVEGYALSIIPHHHAWLARRGGSEAYDVTWDDGKNGSRGSEYFGIAFDPAWAWETVLKVGKYSIFSGWNIDLLTGFLKDGIPEEALANGGKDGNK